MVTDVALVDGTRMPLAEAVLPVTDEGVARGDGAFETMGVWGGRAFRPDDHLARLAASLEAVGLPPPDRALLRTEMDTLLDGVGGPDADGALRVYVTASGTRVLTLSPPPQRRTIRRLVPQPAPWVVPADVYRPAGAKTMSYLPNMAATRAAQQAGGDDALLVSLDGVVLEGPTFCVLWVRGGVVHAPSLGLGIVDSISRRTLLELARTAGHELVEGAWHLDELGDADELIVCSSVRPAVGVRQVGELALPAHSPVADALQAALDACRRGLTPGAVSRS